MTQDVLRYDIRGRYQSCADRPSPQRRESVRDQLYRSHESVAGALRKVASEEAQRSSSGTGSEQEVKGVQNPQLTPPPQCVRSPSGSKKAEVLSLSVRAACHHRH